MCSKGNFFFAHFFFILLPSWFMSIKGLDRNVSSSQSTLVKREPIQSQNICQNFYLTYQMCFVKMWKISISRFWWCDICKLSHNVRPMLECHYAEEIHATFVFSSPRRKRCSWIMRFLLSLCKQDMSWSMDIQPEQPEEETYIDFLASSFPTRFADC